MTLMRCTVPPPATITVRGPECGRTFASGDLVDFADHLPGLETTWGHALADHHGAFEPLERPITAERGETVLSRTRQSGNTLRTRNAHAGDGTTEE